jgi:hypothetical protein
MSVAVEGTSSRRMLRICSRAPASLRVMGAMVKITFEYAVLIQQ